MGNKIKGAIIVGIGNHLLKDDRVGIEVVEALKARYKEVETAIFHGPGPEIIDTIMGYEKAVIVGACQIGMRPGTVLEMAPEEIISFENPTNAPGITIGATLKAGQMRFPDKMPKDLKLIRVEVEDISTFSTKCTPAVCHAIADVVERISQSTISYQR